MEAYYETKDENGDEETKELNEVAETIDKFCHDSLPFYSMRIDSFEDRCKRFMKKRTDKNSKLSVSLKQLRFAFKRDSEWSSINNDDSPLCKLLTSEYMRADDKRPQ